MQNNYCDGSSRNQCTPGEVRLYPWNSNDPYTGNSIYCRACFQRENQFRAGRARETGCPEKWPQLEWDKAKVYSAGE